MLRVAFYLLLDASGPEVYRNSVTAANLRPYGQSCQSRPVVFRRGIPSAAVLLCGHVVSVWVGGGCVHIMANPCGNFAIILHM